MDAGLARLNGCRAHEAEAALLACCGSSTWARAMTAARPFTDLAAMLAEADRIWWSLSPEDWLEAFRAHPRIGERADAHADPRSARWSELEQHDVQHGDDAVRALMAAGNRAYEERFGHVFLICASGLAAEQVLQALRQRMGNEPAHELRVAAEQQRRITHLRLNRLIDS